MKRYLTQDTGSKSVLVPLTNSLYVKGELSDADTVLVDVGTGFLVEKVGHPAVPISIATPLTVAQKLKAAEQFYESKVDELGNNLKDLETIVQRKQTNARTIEEGIFTSFCFYQPLEALTYFPAQ